MKRIKKYIYCARDRWWSPIVVRLSDKKITESSRGDFNITEAITTIDYPLFCTIFGIDIKKGQQLKLKISKLWKLKYDKTAGTRLNEQDDIKLPF